MNPGDRVDGRFRIVEQVGAGGMGDVFRATDETTGRDVAIKLFRPQDMELERARREIHVLAQLRHPAIVAHVADGETAGGQLYLAMAWIDGETVAERLAGVGLAVREAVQLVRPLADALAAVHAAGVLHRDIKPSNVVLAGEDPSSAILIDFGVARVTDEGSLLTRTGASIGTPGYMAPEQARAVRALGPATDVFGLGCLLYECLTGKPAFSGSTPAAVMTKVLFGTPVPLAGACPEAPPRLIELVERMLAKPIEERYPGGAAVAAALAVVGELPPGPRRSSRSLDAATIAGSPAAVREIHCIVCAALFVSDDVSQPATNAMSSALADAASAHGAAFQILANGVVVAHLRGAEAPTAARAAGLALTMREILPGWSIAISSSSHEVDEAAEGATRIASACALATLMRKREGGAIVVDAPTAQLLGDGFELGPGPRPELIGRR